MKNILIAAAHYRVYQSASRRLLRQMGAQAPSAEGLIRHELSQRHPRMIADDFLESVGWRRRHDRSPGPGCPLHGLKFPNRDPRRN